jgi:hypothetical protein
MVTWHIVDDDVECLHVERNPTMTCSGSHLYKFYRLGFVAGGTGREQADVVPWALRALKPVVRDQSRCKPNIISSGLPDA